MNLSRRAALLILPVIVAGYTLAALQVYSSQSDSITRLETARLDNRLMELKASFNAYQSFITGFVLNVANGDKLRDFLKERDDAYRIIALRNGMDHFVSRFQQQNLGAASFAVINPQLDIEYFFEDGTDPFSTLGAEELDFARKLFAENRFEESIHQHYGGSSHIVQAYMLDTSTFATPLRVLADRSVLLLASIHPVLYDSLLSATRAEYRASISYLAAPPASDKGFWRWIELKPGYYLHVVPDANYLGSLKREMRYWLVLAVVFLSLTTFALLTFLIRKFITRPVTELDRQLELVVQNRLENIDRPSQNDEISRLGIRFHDMYRELSRVLDNTRAMSRTDALTGLDNRVAFNEVAQHRIADSEKLGKALAFIYVDLDNFKFVNDRYGHDVGDSLLRAFSQRMLNLLAMHVSSDSSLNIFRLSGDEFAIVAQGFSTGEIKDLSSRILSLFKSGFHFDQGTFPVTASLGIANYPDDGHTVTQLISNADLAMYQAKFEGKNRYAFYSRDIAEQSRRSVTIDEQLNRMNPDEEFHLVYMPIVDRTGRCVSCEVLLRWTSPLLGTVSPMEFIPIAECSGQFVKIDYWVIEQAVRSLREVRAVLGEDVNLAINISSAHLAASDIKAYLAETLAKYQVAPSDIEIEITETYESEQISSVLDQLNIFRDRSYSIVIDDFGVGNTSLMQLIDSPIDKIKLDRDFINRVTSSNKSDLVAAFTKLCHIQDIAVTAEGVETEQQYRMLLDAGCDFLQGYYIAKPGSLSELASQIEPDRLLFRKTGFH